jgi:PQQ-like domain
MGTRLLAWLAATAALAVGLPSAVAGAGPSADGRLWVSRYNHGMDQARAVGISPDGSKLFVTGQSGPSYNPDYATVAFDAATGARLWAARYDGPDKNFDDASALIVSPDGSKVFVTGTSSRGLYDFATLAYDAATGSQLWIARYNSGCCGDNYAKALGVSPDGSKVFVTGWGGSTSNPDYATVAYDATTGDQLWATTYDGPQHGTDLAYALALSPDGSKVFVAGDSGPISNGRDYATVAYDAATGAQLWASRYDVGYVDEPHALGVSPDGSKIFLTGESTPPGSSYRDYVTIAYDAASGSRLWTQQYSAPRAKSTDVAYALGVSPDGSKVFVTGKAWYGPSPASYDYATVAYDAATGTQLWLSRYDKTGGGDDIARALSISPDGSQVFVTGQSFESASGDDYATVAYDSSTGGRLWVKRYNGAANGTDDAQALAVSPDGSNVFVTGRSEGTGSDFDYATVAYDSSTGGRLWVKRYNGAANGTDDAQALAVSPDGSNVFVTGRSEGTGSDFDYATVAYSTGLITAP